MPIVSQDLSTHRLQAQKVRSSAPEMASYSPACLPVASVLRATTRLPQRFRRDSTIPPAQMKQPAFIRKSALPEREKVFSSMKHRTPRHAAADSAKLSTTVLFPCSPPCTESTGVAEHVAGHGPHTTGPVRCSNQHSQAGPLGRPTRIL